MGSISLGRFARRELDARFWFIAFASFELEGLEHGLVVLGLVLDDHVVDEAVSEERVVPVEVHFFEGLEDRFADGVEVHLRVAAV